MSKVQKLTFIQPQEFRTSPRAIAVGRTWKCPECGRRYKQRECRPCVDENEFKKGAKR